MNGLSSQEAKAKLEKYGPNVLPEEKRHPLVLFLSKFFSPVSWLLEIIIGLEIFLGKYPESIIIGLLLVFNALVSFLQEHKAEKAIALLKKKLEVFARVLRDGMWSTIPAQELVPEDLIRIRMGDLISADLKVREGIVSIDRSAITGESLPVESKIGEIVYAGSIVSRGEANALVVATGERTFYGKTAHILQTTKTPSHLEKTIFLIVKYLLIFESVLILLVFIYSYFQGVSLIDLIPFSLLLLVASVPVALPATYSLTTALGSTKLARTGVLVTRLTAIEEAAAMDFLCVDKTGTITLNLLSISRLKAFAPYSEDDLLVLASLASEIATQDPIDLAITKTVRHSRFSECEKLKFIPFDAERKCSEAIIRYQEKELHILKGSFHRNDKDFQEMAKDGSRVITVLVDQKLVGFIGLQDLPRENSKQVIAAIHEMGVRVQMMTGDAKTTAEEIGKQVGIKTEDIIAEMYPEDKFHLIENLQKKGHVTGMTGDGVNDAPALKKAEVGIAVSNATDVAKAAASIVLTRPGLEDILEAIRSSRKIYQRMLTYTQNKIIKTLEISILLGLGLVFMHDFIISQLLIVLLLFANDFITMSISTDHMAYSRTPDKWNVRRLIFRSGMFATLILGFSFGAFWIAHDNLQLSLPQLQTWVFLILVFTGQCTVYLIREQRHFWHSCPSWWMIGLSFFDIIATSWMAGSGILMAPLPISLILSLFGSVIVYFFLLDFLKVYAVNYFL